MKTTLTLKKERGLIKMYLEKHGKIKKISEFNQEFDTVKIKYEDIKCKTS